MRQLFLGLNFHQGLGFFLTRSFLSLEEEVEFAPGIIIEDLNECDTEIEAKQQKTYQTEDCRYR